MTLFEEPNEWEGMPEFIQEKKEAYSKIIVRFDNEDKYIATGKVFIDDIYRLWRWKDQDIQFDDW